MTYITFGEAFSLNPTVKIAKGEISPFVDMATVQPFTRDVLTDSLKPFSSGTKFVNGDVLMARITPSLENGKTSIYRASSRWSHLPAFGSTEFIVIRGRADLSSTEFAYYVATSQIVRDIAIGSMNGSSGRQRVQLDSISNIKLTLPSLTDQEAIAAKLASLDDKISQNAKLINEASYLMQSYIEQSLESSPEYVSVAKLATFINGGAYTKGASGSGRMVLRIAELNSGPGASTVYNDIEVPADRTAKPGDILMSWSGTLGVYRWFRDEAIVNQHIFKVIPNGYPVWLVFDRLCSAMPIFKAIAQDKATTMGHIKRVHLEQTEVAIPNGESLEKIALLAGNLWDRVSLAERETMELSALRDLLREELVSPLIVSNQI